VEESVKNKMRKIQLIVSVAMCAFGCALLACGFIAQPMGEIHPSILTAFGEILTFCGALLGMDYKYRYKE
jgi:hypothetical protein